MLLIIMVFRNLYAQDKLQFSAGADLVNHYVWRGIDYGYSPAIQPDVELNYKGFYVGGWGTYAFLKSNAVYEFEYRVGYTFEKIGLSLQVIDYVYSTATFDSPKTTHHVDQDESSIGHSFELGVIQRIKDFHFAGYINFSEDNDIYVEVGYNYKGFELIVGAGNHEYTLNDNFNLVNVSLTKTFDLKLTEKYSPSLFCGTVYNPDASAVHLIFGVNF
ncbi:TorF family putative porin [Flammeovirga sp. SJP92]|uniref:TorF family putative porin n=1 Tax=Flammeovirga sp. SJP92 TaxID=1775430 RepID=UPI00156129DA|nr:TorF family putative porin [Flammeovirga sp. SJP92]